MVFLQDCAGLQWEKMRALSSEAEDTDVAWEGLDTDHESDEE